MKKIKVTFYGVRGSTPSPSKRTVKYGGNTACLEITSGNQRIICDAGTGIRNLGKKLMRSPKGLAAGIFLSHIHWDHISGLPFFEPIYVGENRFDIFGPEIGREKFKDLLKEAISPPFFPVPISKMKSKVKIRGLAERPLVWSDMRIVPLLLNHPDGTFGWKFEFKGGKRILYVSDNEPGGDNMAMIRWARGADLLIHDAQYTPGEYDCHRGWGHSPYTYPIDIAVKAGVGRLVLTHFDPDHSDIFLDKFAEQVKKHVKVLGLKIPVILAREGMRISL